MSKHISTKSHTFVMPSGETVTIDAADRALVDVVHLVCTCQLDDNDEALDGGSMVVAFCGCRLDHSDQSASYKNLCTMCLHDLCCPLCRAGEDET